MYSSVVHPNGTHASIKCVLIGTVAMVDDVLVLVSLQEDLGDAVDMSWCIRKWGYCINMCTHFLMV